MARGFPEKIETFKMKKNMSRLQHVFLSYECKILKSVLEIRNVQKNAALLTYEEKVVENLINQPMISWIISSASCALHQTNCAAECVVEQRQVVIKYRSPVRICKKEKSYKYRPIWLVGSGNEHSCVK